MPSFSLSGNQTPLVPILSSNDIPIVTTASHMTDNLSSSSIQGHQRRAHMQIASISGTTPTLVPGAQNRNPIALVAFVNNFQQKQKVWFRFLPLFDNETIRAAIHIY